MHRFTTFRCNCHSARANHVGGGSGGSRLQLTLKIRAGSDLIPPRRRVPLSMQPLMRFKPRFSAAVPRLEPHSGESACIRLCLALATSFETSGAAAWTWVAPAGWQGGGTAASCALCPAPGCFPVVVRKIICALHPFRPLSQRKVYVKIHEMCQNTA